MFTGTAKIVKVNHFGGRNLPIDLRELLRIRGLGQATVQHDGHTIDLQEVA